MATKSGPSYRLPTWAALSDRFKESGGFLLVGEVLTMVVGLAFDQPMGPPGATPPAATLVQGDAGDFDVQLVQVSICQTFCSPLGPSHLTFLVRRRG